MVANGSAEGFLGRQRQWEEEKQDEGGESGDGLPPLDRWSGQAVSGRRLAGAGNSQAFT